MDTLKNKALFDLTRTIAADILPPEGYPWEALGRIGGLIARLGPTLPAALYDRPAPDVWIARDATLAPSACILGACIIGPGADIRHCAYIRGNAIVGAGAVVGNSTELKNVVLFDGVQVPHYNYVGDAILGHRAHMGAGAITSNVKSDGSNVVVHTPEGPLATGLRKFGAVLGDRAEIGCNSVLCPGSVVGADSIVYPLSRVRGFVPAWHIYKDADAIVQRQ